MKPTASLIATLEATKANDADGFWLRWTFAKFGGQLGAAHVSPSTNNGMEMEFTVKPSQVGIEPGIVFDLSRAAVLEVKDFIGPTPVSSGCWF